MTDARTLYVNGRILGAGLRPAGEAMLVSSSSILWLGAVVDAAQHQDAALTVVDLENAVVTTPFVDAHVHLSQIGANLRGLDLSDARSLAEALSQVETAARRAGGRPLLAANWDETTWPERRPFTARELDRAAYGGVVYAPRIDGHSAVVSSALAAAARLDPSGMPDGWVVVEANQRARAVFEASVTPAQRHDDLRLAMRHAASLGVAFLHENGGVTVSSPEDFADVLQVADERGMPAVVGYWAELATTDAEAVALRRSRSGAVGLAGDLNIDGSIGSRTASLRADYADQPGHRGNPFLTVAQVRDHVLACTRAGLQGGFHVIGEAGVDTAIAGFEAAAETVGAEPLRAARHRLEHLEMIDADGARRLAWLGVIASVQPAFDAQWGGAGGMYETRLGARWRRMNPLRTLLDAGVTVALGSDSPVTPIAPWDGLRAAVTHHDEEERITAAEAFDAHTVGGHRAACSDAGELVAGAAADFVIWDDAGGWFDETGALTLGAMAAPAPTARETWRAGSRIHPA